MNKNSKALVLLFYSLHHYKYIFSDYQALYSLGYMVENKIPLDRSIRIENTTSWTDLHGNLNIAAKLYQR